MSVRTAICPAYPETAGVRRGSPGPFSLTPALPPNPHNTPVPSPAHPTSRAICVLRSPR